MKIEIGEIKKIALEPDEVLLIRVPMETAGVEYDALLKAFQKALPNNFKIIYPSKLEFTKVKRAEIKEDKENE